MQRFGSTFGAKVNAALFTLLFTGQFYFTLNVPNRSMVVSGTVMFGALSIFAAWLAFNSVVAASSVYEVDDEAITRKSLLGIQSIRWAELERTTTTGSSLVNRLILTDSVGRRVTVQWGSIARQAELQSLLAPRIAAVQNRLVSQVSREQRVFYPSRTAGWAGIAVIVMCALLAVGAIAIGSQSSTTSSPAPVGGIAVLVGFAIFGAIFFLVFTLQAFTRTLTVASDGLRDKNIFGEKFLPYDAITSVMSREVRTNNGSFNQTVIESPGRKISVTSQMQDYYMLVEAVRSRAGSSAKAAGSAAANAADGSELRLGRRLLPVIGLLTIVSCALPACMGLTDGRDRNARLDLMDAQGLRTEGVVTSRAMDGPKGFRYTVYYTFTDSIGAPHKGASMVSEADYYRTPRGTQVSVIYVPGNPQLCRMTASIGRSKAKADIRSGVVFIVAGAVLTPIIMLMALRDIKRREAKLKRQAA